MIGIISQLLTFKSKDYCAFYSGQQFQTFVEQFVHLFAATTLIERHRSQVVNAAMWHEIGRFGKCVLSGGRQALREGSRKG